MPPWKEMWRGDGCLMCADAGLLRNEYSDLIAETRTSFVMLGRNQTQAGCSVVIAKRHVPTHNLRRIIRSAGPHCARRT